MCISGVGHGDGDYEDDDDDDCDDDDDDDDDNGNLQRSMEAAIQADTATTIAAVTTAIVSCIS